jgi:AcrR family transcriptional regulator
VTKKKAVACKRPYDLGRRLERSDRKRAAILKTARKQLESNGFLQLTMDSLARETGVTRQTIHNLFGTKAELLEAIFDQLAMDAGMERMRAVMQDADADAMLEGFVKVFTDFWTKDRLLIRRIHGIAAIDPEFGAAIEARNRRRQMAAARVVDRMSKETGESDVRRRAKRIATLYALTSFEFFDALGESFGSLHEIGPLILDLVRKARAYPGELA